MEKVYKTANTPFIFLALLFLVIYGILYGINLRFMLMSGLLVSGIVFFYFFFPAKVIISEKGVTKRDFGGKTTFIPWNEVVELAVLASRFKIMRAYVVKSNKNEINLGLYWEKGREFTDDVVRMAKLQRSKDRFATFQLWSK